MLGGSELEEIELNHLDGHKGSRPVRIGNGAATHIQLVRVLSSYFPEVSVLVYNWLDCASNVTCRISMVNCEFVFYLKVCQLFLVGVIC
jgi:hypothetical protein